MFVSARGKNYKNHSAGGEGWGGGGGSAKEKNEESIRELQVL